MPLLPKHTRRLLLLALALSPVGACDPVKDGPAATTPAASSTPEGPAPRGARGNPPAPPPAPPPIAEDARHLQAVVLAPSPLETKKAVLAAGIDAELARLVPVRHFRLDDTSPAVVAIRTGVVLADTILSLEITDDKELDQRLGEILAGLTSVGAGKGLCASVAELRLKTANKAISRADLLVSLDSLVGMAVPGQSLGGTDSSGPLVQAGAWLATTNLVAEAAVRGKKTAAADQLLHQASVAEWFLAYVRSGAQGKAPDDVLMGLEGQLVALRDLASKPRFTDEDVEAIRSKTAGMLGLL